MSHPENQAGLLNRNKAKENKESVFLKVLEEVEKETTNNALATQFPEWDLKPPAALVKRRSTKLL
ncbi:hypothetical protein C0971_16910 [Bacillus methanolicus]|uniref:hypothetical protein n=1 Tax=Bacillus methanolicus TaxID=1471 RepID=UPI00200F465D|nr:hypothetical protein [Bacillus methanolicus]UQD53511.1 hypothetical protein C0971_16910 [Bacillus methanolicus]